MNNPSFETILFGFAFSPNLEANILETARMAYFFQAKLILFHVGAKTTEKEIKLNTLIKKIKHDSVSLEIHWKEGKPVQIILEACKKLDVDLLVIGALQHENMYQFYVGSIARKLTRQVCCSVLLLIKPSVERHPCKHIVVNGLDAPETPLAITTAFYVSHALKSHQITIVEEILQKEVHVAVEDDKSLKRANIMKERLEFREESRIRKILKTVPDTFIDNIRVKTQSIFGKRGYSIGHYAEVVRADLLVMNAPTKSGIWHRIFPHDIEHILSDLPTDLLIIRKLI